MSSCSDEFVDAHEFSPGSSGRLSPNIEDSKHSETSAAIDVNGEKSLEDREREEDSLTVQEIEKRRDDAMLLKDKETHFLNQCCVERSVIYANRAACHIKLDSPEAALLDCNESLSLQPDYVKCLERRATLLESKDRLTDAFEDYKKLLQLDPGNQRARHACATLPERIQIQNEKMKEEMLGQLKQLGNLILKPFGLSTNNFKVQKNPDSEGYSINFVQNAGTSSQ
ncbi:unnamed protein product [Heterobilharzia americana]|nr:unnamed protein product [Heterobilharzia americana]